MSLELFVGNYNIDASSPPEVPELARKWLQAHVYPTEAGVTGVPPTPRHIDVYVLGFQEVKHFEAGEDVLVFPMTNQDAWEQATLSAMNWHPNGTTDSDPFVLLHRVVYSSAMIVVAARSSLLHADGAHKKLVNSGILTHKLHDGVMTGKKGVCGVEFDVLVDGHKSASLALMTSHFQAYSEKLDERLWDAQQVVDALQWPSKLTTTQHDTAVLVGDLNYRIVLPIDEVKQRIATNDLIPLLKADELTTNTVGLVHIDDAHYTAPTVDSPVFVGWKEAPIHFKPTYKFVNGTDTWDDSGKQRTPAWCDRVVTHGPAKVHYYTSATALKFSDHRPILALVSVPLPSH